MCTLNEKCSVKPGKLFFNVFIYFLICSCKFVQKMARAARNLFFNQIPRQLLRRYSSSEVYRSESRPKYLNVDEVLGSI